jgi:hypothetical protein
MRVAEKTNAGSTGSSLENDPDQHGTVQEKEWLQ